MFAYFLHSGELKKRRKMSLGSVSGIEIAKQVQRMIKTKRTSQQIIFLKFFSQFFDLIFCQKYILFCSSFSEFLLLLDPSPIISYRRTVHGLLPVYFCSFTLSDNGLRQWKLSFFMILFSFVIYFELSL